jgi:Nuclease A inhibitor-like protein
MSKDTSDPLLTALQKACKGLLFISETEAKLEPFVWTDGSALTDDRLLTVAAVEKGTAIETMVLSAFFRAVPKENKAKFDALTKVLNECMTGITVYKIGEVNLKVFIVGKAKDGRWAGVKTEVVET